MDLVYKKKEILGLDIGTASVKFVQLKDAGKLTKLTGYGRLDIPDGYIIEGVISEPEKLAEILAKSFKEPPWGKITAKRVIASLPEARVFTRIITLPNMGAKEVSDAVSFEVEQSVPISINDLYLDWGIIDQNEKEITVFFSAAPKAIINSYVQLFDALELEPSALEISMAAIARSMISNKKLTEPILILDIGGQSTNMAVFDSNIRITESHPLGGSTMKDEIMNSCSVSREEAANIVRQGLKAKEEAAKAIKGELDKITAEIEKMLNYYDEKNPEAKVSRILICGGLGFLPGLPEYISEKINIVAQVGNPWVNISIYPLKPVPKEEVPGYAAAIGLCLRGFND